MAPKDIIVTDHARFEMERRVIDEGFVLKMARGPEQAIDVGKGRQVYQSRYHDQAKGKEMLLRLVVELREEGLRVVTVYKTSKVDRYWHTEAES